MTRDESHGADVRYPVCQVMVGLTALLEVPLNRFRWKGGGHLRIDAKGISIGVKRGIPGLVRRKSHSAHFQ